MTKPLPSVNVGVDVGKAQLDLYLLEREQAISVPNDEQAIASLLRRLARYRLERIVIEATGRLEQTFVRAALSEGLPIVVVSPLKIRRFAGAIGQLKTLDRELAALELLIDHTVDQHAPSHLKRELLTSMPGIGNCVAATLIGDLPE